MAPLLKPVKDLLGSLASLSLVGALFKPLPPLIQGVEDAVNGLGLLPAGLELDIRPHAIDPVFCNVNYTAAPIANITFQAFNRTTANIYRFRQQSTVNLGGWFVHEAWMTPSLFSCAGGNRSSEIDLASGFTSTDSARQALEQHWDTFIDLKSDLSYLASTGINTIRLPVGYWSLGAPFTDGTPFEPYSAVYANSWPRIMNTISQAEQHGLGVIVDLHGAPGSQNGLPSSGVSDGRQSLFGNTTNINSTQNALIFMTQQLAAINNIVGIELLNEPSNDPSLESFYNETIAIMRNQTEEAAFLPIYLSDAFDLKRFSAFVANRSDHIVLDHHAYYIFNGTSDDTSEKFAASSSYQSAALSASGSASAARSSASSILASAPSSSVVSTSAASSALNTRSSSQPMSLMPTTLARLRRQNTTPNAPLPADQPTSASVSELLVDAAHTTRRNIIVGEFSCALANSSLASQSAPLDAQRRFCEAQRGMYANVTSGWAFWSYKLEDCEPDWCFRSAVGSSLPVHFSVWNSNTSYDFSDADVQHQIDAIPQKTDDAILGAEVKVVSLDASMSSTPSSISAVPSLSSAPSASALASGSWSAIYSSANAQFEAWFSSYMASAASSASNIASASASDSASLAVCTPDTGASGSASVAPSASIDSSWLSTSAMPTDAPSIERRFGRSRLHAGLYRPRIHPRDFRGSRRTTYTLQEQAIIKAYSDGFTTVKIFAQQGGSRIGFADQLIRDNIAGLVGTPDLSDGMQEVYATWFYEGLKDAESQIEQILASSANSPSRRMLSRWI